MGGSVIVVTHVDLELVAAFVQHWVEMSSVTEDLREAGLPARADAVIEISFCFGA
jgi:hypothetical protein